VLYPSTEPQKPFLPLLGLSVIASSGTVAREAANIWATVMIAETRKLAAATRASAVDFIVSEYPKAAQRLNAEELNLETLKRQQEAALQAVKNTAALSLKEGQLWSREQLVVTLEEQRNRLTLDLEETAASVKALEQELAKVPPVIVVRKGLTDDGVLDSAARGGGKLPPSVADARLQTEQVNPVHTELTRRLSEARVRLTELSASRPVLDAQIDQTRRDALSIRAALGNGVLSISNLERQHEVEAAAKGREVESARANFRKLEEQIGDAQIVMADKESSIMLGSLAELPETPSGPPVARTVGAFGLAGLALALFAAWIADRAKKRTAPA
jgi:uncharacterized protein involved in exopolysaccharide biosynthesis